MTNAEWIISEILELYPYKNGKFPLTFVQYPEVDKILNEAPKIARALEICLDALRKSPCACTGNGNSVICNALGEVESIFGDENEDAND